MKRIYFVLLLMLPIVANAQRSATGTKSTNAQKEAEKKTTKYEDFVSKSGIVYTTYTYPMDEIVLVWKDSTSTFNDQLYFSIEKISIGNASASFLQIHHIKYVEASLVMMEESNVKDLCNSLIKMKEIIKNPVPEGAKAQYSYFNSDGVVVLYEDDVWKIQLERFTKDHIRTSDIDPFIKKLQEIIQKFESIK